MSLPHHEAGFTASSLWAAFVVLLFVKMLLEPVSFGGAAGCFLSHGLMASAVFEKKLCVPFVTRFQVVG